MSSSEYDRIIKDLHARNEYYKMKAARIKKYRVEEQQLVDTFCKCIALEYLKGIKAKNVTKKKKQLVVLKKVLKKLNKMF